MAGTGAHKRIIGCAALALRRDESLCEMLVAVCLSSRVPGKIADIIRVHVRTLVNIHDGCIFFVCEYTVYKSKMVPQSLDELMDHVRHPLHHALMKM
jgi:hypothetical protein